MIGIGYLSAMVRMICLLVQEARGLILVRLECDYAHARGVNLTLHPNSGPGLPLLWSTVCHGGLGRGPWLRMQNLDTNAATPLWCYQNVLCHAIKP